MENSRRKAISVGRPKHSKKEEDMIGKIKFFFYKYRTNVDESKHGFCRHVS